MASCVEAIFGLKRRQLVLTVSSHFTHTILTLSS